MQARLRATLNVAGTIEIRCASDCWDQIAKLTSVAERIFAPIHGHEEHQGAKGRAAGWFSRKLHREVVSAELSAIALEPGQPLDRAQGYCLVGCPPSLPRVARTAGIGVVPESRGRGLGSRVVREAQHLCAAKGFVEMQTIADARSEGWYLAQGFVACRRQCTLMTFCRGPKGPVTRPLEALPWGDSVPHSRADTSGRSALGWPWLREAWELTPKHERMTLDHPVEAGAAARTYISLEGSALLVHRVDTRHGGGPAALEALAASLPLGTPLLVYGCSMDAASTHDLLARGWTIAQPSTVLTFSLRA